MAIYYIALVSSYSGSEWNMMISLQKSSNEIAEAFASGRWLIWKIGTVFKNACKISKERNFLIGNRIILKRQI